MNSRKNQSTKLTIIFSILMSVTIFAIALLSTNPVEATSSPYWGYQIQKSSLSQNVVLTVVSQATTSYDPETHTQNLSCSLVGNAYWDSNNAVVVEDDEEGGWLECGLPALEAILTNSSNWTYQTWSAVSVNSMDDAALIYRVNATMSSSQDHRLISDSTGDDYSFALNFSTITTATLEGSFQTFSPGTSSAFTSRGDGFFEFVVSPPSFGTSSREFQYLVNSTAIDETSITGAFYPSHFEEPTNLYIGKNSTGTIDAFEIDPSSCHDPASC